MTDGKSSGRVVDSVPRPARATLVGATHDRRQTPLERFERAGPGALSLLVGLVAWEVCGRVWAIPFLPPLSIVLQTVVRLTLTGQIVGDLLLGLGNVALGYGLAVCCGVGLGLVTGVYRKAEYAMDPILSCMLASPKLLFMPVPPSSASTYLKGEMATHELPAGLASDSGTHGGPLAPTRTPQMREPLFNTRFSPTGSCF